MIIVWDEEKSRANMDKHGLSFETAQRVFDDPLHLSRQDRLEGGEQRWQTIGLAEGVVLLLVVHTYTDAEGQENIRIISARKADRTERRIYAEGH